MGKLTPIHELGVEEAYKLLTGMLGVDADALPPLDAIENEDWGRDYLLSQFQELPTERLRAVGLCIPESSEMPPGEAD